MNHINTQLRLQCTDIAMKYGKDFGATSTAEVVKLADDLFNSCLDKYEDAREQSQALIKYFQESGNPDLLQELILALQAVQENIAATVNVEAAA